MALNRGEINPLNVLGFRKLTFIPKHFTKILIDHKIDTKAIEHWIEYNLNSRYAIKVSHMLDQNRKFVQVFEIGLEDPKEISMLTLGCNHLHKFKKEY
jgi:hypothetical protein